MSIHACHSNNKTRKLNVDTKSSYKKLYIKPDAPNK